MIKKIINRYINKLTYKEYVHPVFGKFNERPVEYRFVFEQIQSFYPKTVLDVGTGVTALPHLMANCGCKVAAIDNIKDYWTREMFNRHYHVINDDITDTKLKEKFDMITCISTLEHINKADKAVENMFSLLNKSGLLILTFPYNETKGVENIYELPGSSVKALPKYQTRAYSRKDIDRWQKENNAEIINQEYWQFFTGEYWTQGEMILPPKKTSPSEKHHISCLLFKKR